MLIALDNLDEVIAIIRKSRTAETARNNLMKEIKVSEAQAQAILDMQLRRLAGLERKKIQDEHKEKDENHQVSGGVAERPAQKVRQVDCRRN